MVGHCKWLHSGTVRGYVYEKQDYKFNKKNLFLSGFETHINLNNGAVAEWHEGDELQPHTHWFESSPRLK